MKHFFFCLFLCTLSALSYSADQKEIFTFPGNTRAFLKDASKNGTFACATGTACLLASQGLPPHCSPCAMSIANACCSRSVEQCCYFSTTLLPTTCEERVATTIACAIPLYCPLSHGLALECISTSCISCVGSHALILLLKKSKNKIKTFIDSSTFFTSINDEDENE